MAAGSSSQGRGRPRNRPNRWHRILELVGALILLGWVSALPSLGEEPGLTPEEQKLVKRAQELHSKGYIAYQQGKLEEAIQFVKESLTLRQTIYPIARYPLGHPDLASSLIGMGSLLKEQGEYAAAKDYFLQALA